MTPTTGLEALLLVVRLTVLTQPLRFFLPSSLILFAVGVIWSLPYFLMHRGLSVAGLFLMLSAVLIFCMGTLADQIAALIRLRLRR